MKQGLGCFSADDLVELDERLLARADRVVSMREIWVDGTPEGTIGLRHDVDDNPRSLDTALELAAWEAERGYRSTFFLLHGSHYWRHVGFAVPLLEALGHEVGIHVNAIAEALRSGGAPETILHGALSELRAAGATVIGAVEHGDELCYRGEGMSGPLEFVNDEIFEECPRPKVGERPRDVSGNGRTVHLIPLPLRAFGLGYASSRLPRPSYLSDSGSEWRPAFDDAVRSFGNPPSGHILMHPDWWSTAFA